MIAPLARRAGQRDAAGRHAHLHQPALASAARDDRAQPDLPSRRPGLGDAAAHARRRWTSWSRRPASRRSTSASTSGASSPSRSRGASEALSRWLRHGPDLPRARAEPAVAAARPFGSPSSAPFFYRPTASPTGWRRCATNAGSIVFAWERAHPVPRLDDRALLVDHSVLRPVAVPLPRRGRARPLAAPLLTAQVVAVACFLLFPLRRPSCGRPTPGPARLPVRGARRLRQAVQPGAVAAHRAAGDHLGALCAPRAGALARRSLHIWCVADRRLGADDVAAPFHRHPDRRAARLLLPVALARPRRKPARRAPG